MGEEGEQATGPHRTAGQVHCLNTEGGKSGLPRPAQLPAVSTGPAEQAARPGDEESGACMTRAGQSCLLSALDLARTLLGGHSPQPLSLELGQGRKGAPSP